MDTPRLPDPSLLMQVAGAYRSSAALFAAAELDIFGALADGPKTSAEVARARECHEPSMRLLLEPCAMAGLLVMSDGRYSNTPVVKAFLVPGGPAYTPHILKYPHNHYPPSALPPHPLRPTPP